MSRCLRHDFFTKASEIVYSLLNFNYINPLRNLKAIALGLFAAIRGAAIDFSTWRVAALEYLG